MSEPCLGTFFFFVLLIDFKGQKLLSFGLLKKTV